MNSRKKKAVKNFFLKPFQSFDWVYDLIVYSGASSFSYGAYIFMPVLGYLSAGVFLMALGWMGAKSNPGNGGSN